MSEGALKRQFGIAFGVVIGVLIAGVIGFLIPAAYFTHLTGEFSLLWIGAFIFAAGILAFLIAIWCCARSP